ncbi:hypothetical protein EVAR_19745_1 [Eumeta japonica]|uniref:Uncharacterized protein n=1 Tax=Eumeta variegata TaxID=151549 RepID=A0A4C1USC1_EUMVA|nr:hypothetical protein EVAR_19745_1 [Eumeta japonica]
MIAILLSMPISVILDHGPSAKSDFGSTSHSDSSHIILFQSHARFEPLCDGSERAAASAGRCPLNNSCAQWTCVIKCLMAGREIGDKNDRNLPVSATRRGHGGGLFTTCDCNVRAGRTTKCPVAVGLVVMTMIQ